MCENEEVHEYLRLVCLFEPVILDDEESYTNHKI